MPRYGQRRRPSDRASRRIGCGARRRERCANLLCPDRPIPPTAWPARPTCPTAYGPLCGA